MEKNGFMPEKMEVKCKWPGHSAYRNPMPTLLKFTLGSSMTKIIPVEKDLKSKFWKWTVNERFSVNN